MKKGIKIIITVIVCLVLAGAIVGTIALHDRNTYSDVAEQIKVTDKTIELADGEIDIPVNDIVNASDLNCSAVFEDGKDSFTVNTGVSDEQTVKIIVTANDTVLFGKPIEYTAKIIIKDTTPPEFIDSVDEIKITEGEDIDILSKFKATDLSDDVTLSVEKDIDNTKIGKQNIKVIAKDVNGNKTEKEVKIIVQAKPEETTKTVASSSNRKNNNTSSSSNSGNSSRPSSTNNSSSGRNNGGGSSNNSSGNSKPSNSGSGTTTTKHVCCHIGNCGRRFNSYDELNNYYLQWAIKQGGNYSGYFNGWQCSCGKWSADFISY